MSSCICDQGRIYMAGRLWNPDCPIHGEDTGPGDRLQEVLDEQLRKALGPPPPKPIGNPSTYTFSMSDELDEKLKTPDPDKPHDDDPPINAMSMLEVLEEAQDHYKHTRMVAQDMQAATAIRAILDGTDPREVAEACGYKFKREHQSLGQSVMMTPFGPVQIVSSLDDIAPDDGEGGMEAFASWLCNYLSRRAKGVKVHG